MMILPIKIVYSHLKMLHSNLHFLAANTSTAAALALIRFPFLRQDCCLLFKAERDCKCFKVFGFLSLCSF